MAQSSGDTSQTDSGAGAKPPIAARHHRTGRKLIVASNRGPLSFSEDHTGEITPRSEWTRGFEQFESLSEVEISWVAGAVSSADRRAADLLADSTGIIENDVLPNDWSTRLVSLPRRVHHKFYNVICNPLLWFLLHRSWSPTFTPNVGRDEHDAWERGYKAVNEMFAQAVSTAAGDAKITLLCRDYQLMLVPGFVRSEHPSALIHQSFETPWPWPSEFEILPTQWRRDILGSLLAADTISFPTKADISAFVACVNTTYGNSELINESQSAVLRWKGHEVALAVSAPNVRPTRFGQVVEFETTRRAVTKLGEWSGGHTFVTVDRAEPHKNIVRSVNAFGELLKRQPELADQARFLLYLTPGPAHISAYKRLIEEVRRSARRINERFSGLSPVRIHEDGSFSRSIAGLVSYDTLVSIPVVDGVARPALDGGLINQNSGAMILSKTSAAADVFGDQVRQVDFADIDAIANAMSEAIADSKDSRLKKSQKIQDIAKHHATATDTGRPVFEIIERLLDIGDRR